jgi:hypothetical protein
VAERISDAPLPHANADFWTSTGSLATIFFSRIEQVRRGARYIHGVVMIAVIGNMFVGLGVVSLFTATLRLNRPRK